MEIGQALGELEDGFVGREKADGVRIGEGTSLFTRVVARYGQSQVSPQSHKRLAKGLTREGLRLALEGS